MIKLLRTSRYFMLLAILIGSTGIFLLWWNFGRKTAPLLSEKQAEIALPKSEAEHPQSPPITDPHPGNWLLIDNRLLDVETKEWLSPSFLEGDPKVRRIAFWKDQEMIVVRHDRGHFSRYDLQGKRLPDFPSENLLPKYRLLNKHLTKMIYSLQGDLWMADLDWEKGDYINFRQITRVGFFDDRKVPEQVLFTGGDQLFLRTHQHSLRVSLLTGKVEEIKLPLGRFVQPNPEGDCIIGTGRDQSSIIIFDLLKDEPQLIQPTQRGAIIQFQWISNTECLILRSGKDIRKFNRESGKLEDVYRVSSKGQISALGSPSPNNEWILINSSIGSAALQLKSPHAIRKLPTLGRKWISSHEMLFCNASPNSEERGTWIYNLRNESTRRILPFPAVTNHRKALPIMQLENETLILIHGKEIWKLPYGAESFEKVAGHSHRLETAHHIPEWTPPKSKNKTAPSPKTND